MDEPVVAIITRTKNRPVFLRRAINSVLHQNYPHWVHVIVNDGGDPGVVDTLVAEFTSEYSNRLKVIHLPESLGMQPAANHAIQHSSSELLVIHDDDDAWDPAFLGVCAHYLAKEGENSGYQGVITHTLRIWENVLADGTIEEVSREPYIPLNQISLFRLGYENPFAPIAFVYRRKVYDEIGGYNPTYSYAADMEFNLRFLQRYDIGVIREPLAHYHWRKEAASEELHNTVTARAKEHERLNNELMNAVMRADGTRPNPLGLALNVARFAVENQWMTTGNWDKIRSIDTKVDRLAVIEQCLSYATRIAESIDKQTAAAIDFHHKNKESADGQVEALYKLLQDQKNHLNSLTHLLSVLSNAQSDSRGHLNSVSLLLSSLSSAQRDTKEHLTSLTNQNQDLVALINACIRQNEDQAARIRQMDERLNRQAAEGQNALLKLLSETVLIKLGPLKLSWKIKRK